MVEGGEGVVREESSLHSELWLDVHVFMNTFSLHLFFLCCCCHCIAIGTGKVGVGMNMDH